MSREYYYQNTMYDGNTCIEDAKDMYLNQNKRNCFNCSHSGVTENDEFWCALHQKVVQENETCEDWN